MAEETTPKQYNQPTPKNEDFEKIQEYVAEKVVPKDINDFKEYSDPIAPNNPNNQS